MTLHTFAQRKAAPSRFSSDFLGVIFFEHNTPEEDKQQVRRDCDVIARLRWTAVRTFRPVLPTYKGVVIHSAVHFLMPRHKMRRLMLAIGEKTLSHKCYCNNTVIVMLFFNHLSVSVSPLTLTVLVNISLCLMMGSKNEAILCRDHSSSNPPSLSGRERDMCNSNQGFISWSQVQQSLQHVPLWQRYLIIHFYGGRIRHHSATDTLVFHICEVLLTFRHPISVSLCYLATGVEVSERVSRQENQRAHFLVTFGNWNLKNAWKKYTLKSGI